RWHRLDDQLREVRLTLGRCTEARPLVQRLLHSSHDARVAVPKDERAPRTDVMEVAVAVDVVEIRPLAACDVNRMPADGAESTGRAVDAAGDELAGAFESLLATGAQWCHGASTGKGTPSWTAPGSLRCMLWFRSNLGWIR